MLKGQLNKLKLLISLNLIKNINASEYIPNMENNINEEEVEVNYNREIDDPVPIIQVGIIPRNHRRRLFNITDEFLKDIISFTDILFNISTFFLILSIFLNTFFFGKNMIGCLGILNFGLLYLVIKRFGKQGFSRCHMKYIVVITTALIISILITIFIQIDYSHPQKKRSKEYKNTDFSLKGINLVGGGEKDNYALILILIYSYMEIFLVLLNIFTLIIWHCLYPQQRL